MSNDRKKSYVRGTSDDTDDSVAAPPTGRDYEAAASLDLNAAQLKAMGDPLRLMIADLVLERAMTVSELAERVGRPRGTVAHHVDVLVDAGMLQVVRTRKVRAVTERFYGRSALTFNLPDQPGEIPFLADLVGEVDLEAVAADTYPSYFSMRHARIPTERAAEFAQRLDELAREYIDLERGGDTEYGLYLGFYPTTRL